MKEFFSKHLRDIISILIVLVALSLIAIGVLMLVEYTQELNEQASATGKVYSSEIAVDARSAIVSYQAKIRRMADSLSEREADSPAAFAAGVRMMVFEERNSDVMFVRYFLDNDEYDASGNLFDKTRESSTVLQLAKQRVAACAGVVEDKTYSISAMAFYEPLDDNPYADAVVIYVPVRNVLAESQYINEHVFEQSRLAGVCSESGETLDVLKTIEITRMHDYGDQTDETDTELRLHSNIYDVIRGLVNDKSVIDDMSVQFSIGASNAYVTQVGPDNYIVSISSIKEGVADPFAVVTMYEIKILNSSAYATITAIMGAVILFSILLIFVSVYSMISRRIHARRLLALKDVDERLECPTRQKFERVAEDILSRNKATAFAITVVDIKHYEYMNDQLGYDAITQVLLYIKLLFSRLVRVDETYGYLDNGRFVILLHYREEESLETRLRSVCALASSHTSIMLGNFHIALFGGVYLTEQNLTDRVDKMINMAISAEEAVNMPNDFGSFRIYNERLHASNVQVEYIEVHMESALENHDFKVFYQPKYNIDGDRPDGCEALVRWYNPERDEYMQPGVFLPLFEANHFVIKLDRYVYEQVCIYIEDAVAQGQDLYPVSVNVSRISAVQSDFLSYYIAIKKKHNIADGFLTIEFTESFSFEDYDVLREIVNTLHKNGFKCSIDDFGSGFSSYNILKELPMDEIKLDRFFIEKGGMSNDRDIKILSSIISLARELGMKVTQEGVETADQLNLLRKLGCNVIQGYHYAKPLCLDDYISFLAQKSHSSLFVNRSRATGI